MLKTHDIVTVKNPVDAQNYNGEAFTLMPGVVATLWTPPLAERIHFELRLDDGPEYKVGNRTYTSWYFTTTRDNLAAVFDGRSTVFSSAGLLPGEALKAAKLQQQALLLKSRRAAGMDFMDGFAFNSGTWYDRWGKSWHVNQINDMAFSAIKTASDWTPERLRQTMHSLWMTMKFTQVNPFARPEPVCRPTRAMYVNVYCDDRAFGGPEEGGWWYDVSDCVESHKVGRGAARQLLKQKQRECFEQNDGAYPISSVLSQGMYRAELERHPGRGTPTHRPQYS